ncbi:MAG: AAA family ATPase [Candidatus Eremiobacteraeota bacterium]|nr:AAA family ATPase [Candidatus Eremiobacteraeota bacterium]MBV8434476.1 AAA family ATPase [Candidatus Eremiobacteraeota bacterium]MBV8583874.1 AAA family ATPase [Candidatus Eremiobacteraeota bacterium]MBV8655023.1 AAA family ATPase [Candidatus Eremiobacteraeota bacterium]
MSRYYRFFGLERDPFLDTADPYFYCELGALRRAKDRLIDSVDSSRGLTVVLGDPGTGKTSLSSALEQELLSDERTVLGKILDPSFATDVEFLIAVGRVFGLALPPRSSAALKNALKNFFFETAILEKRTLVLLVDEAQNLSHENLEALRLLLNYHVPQRKLLNILLFGQSELETRIAAQGNLADRVDSWIRIGRLDDAMSSAVLDFRLQRAGLAPGQQVFTADARELLVRGAIGLPRRLTMVAHLAMEEAADRASTLVNEDHVLTALAIRGITVDRKPVVTAVNGNIDNGATAADGRGFFRRLFARRTAK